MPGPNVSVSRDLINDTIYRVLGRIDVTDPDKKDLQEARTLLLELSQYIIQAPVQDADQRSLPRITSFK